MKKALVLTLILLGLGVQMNAQTAPGLRPAPTFGDYFTNVSSASSLPDNAGFIRRWSLLEPIARPDITSNRDFTDSNLNVEFSKVYYKDQMTIVPKDCQVVTLEDNTKLKWHWIDCKNYDINLYRFAGGLGLQRTEAMFMAVTVINVYRDVTVRMSVGSNAASMWWLNGEEAILLPGDRHMIIDDFLTTRLVLKAGKNVLRGTIINGPGWSDFCVRFYDMNGNIFRDFTVTNQ